MTFVELSGEQLRIDSLNPPSAEREPVHVHPRQESGAKVVSGSLVFEVAGEQRRLSAGEAIRVPANTPHRFWNDGGEEARSSQFFRPALDIASFFETLFALAQEGKLGAKGMPPPLQLAVMVAEFGDEIRPVAPPWPILRAVTAALGPIARARGYRGRVEYREDRPAVEIKARHDGPYKVTGPVRVIDADGNEYDLTERGETVALCRCGGSTTKPFCDGTHSKVGFQAAERAVAQAEEDEERA